MIIIFAILDSGIYSKTRKTGMTVSLMNTKTHKNGMTVLIGIAEHVYNGHGNAEDCDLLRTFELLFRKILIFRPSANSIK